MASVARQPVFSFVCQGYVRVATTIPHVSSRITGVVYFTADAVIKMKHKGGQESVYVENN